METSAGFTDAFSQGSQIPHENNPSFPSRRWINFLRQYGPIPDNGNSFDEDIQKSAQRNNVQPIRLPTPALEQALEFLKAEKPKSVIVTGTAGDGKTYLCREIWHQLGGAETEWAQPEKVKSLKLGNGYELCLIRDLSEFQPSDRDDWFPRISDDILNESSKRVYLIAANHGRLIDTWKLSPSTGSVIAIRAVIGRLLIGDETVNIRLAKIDLSRQSSSTVIVGLLEAVLNHPGWEGCAQCPSKSEISGKSCPIFENRQRLLGASDGGLLRKRLGELLELSERNGVHFTVRQLLLLTSNILLGHPDAQHGLMACKDVPKIIDKGTSDRASVYQNVFGENVPMRRRETTAVFDALGRFGIGNETTNQIDSILVYGADDPELRELYDRLITVDPIYGASLAFRAEQRNYLENGEAADRSTFVSMLRGQRQRLFFIIPETYADELCLWDLTVFRYAGKYLEIASMIMRGISIQQSRVSLLVRGLNRVFTGILVTNQDQLILASSGSHAQSKTSKIAEDFISVSPRLGEGVSLRVGVKGQLSKEISLQVSLGNIDGLPPILLPLTLLRFEFLCRVADGALPSSFSLECYEDLLAFKANILEAVQQRNKISKEHEQSNQDLTLRFLQIGPDGRAYPEPVEIKLI